MGVVARHRGPVASRVGRAVIDVIDRGRRGDGEHAVARVNDARPVVARDADAIVVGGRNRCGNHPGELARVGPVVGDGRHGRRVAVPQEFDVHRAHRVVAPPTHGERLACRPHFAAVRPNHRHVLGGTLRGLGRVPVGAQIDEPAVGRRFVVMRIVWVAAVDARRSAGVGGPRPPGTRAGPSSG